MQNDFDELAKGMAQSVTRRGALKKFGLARASRWPPWRCLPEFYQPNPKRKEVMNNQFDELTKSMAQSVTRRGALKKFGIGLAGIALGTLGLANSAEAGGKKTCGVCDCGDPLLGCKSHQRGCIRFCIRCCS